MSNKCVDFHRHFSSKLLRNTCAKPSAIAQKPSENPHAGGNKEAGLLVREGQENVPNQ